MNTHDKIELPPLPSPFGIVDPVGTEGLVQYTIRDLQDYAKSYARTAIEADRKRRGNSQRKAPPPPPAPMGIKPREYIDSFGAMVRQPAEPVKVPRGLAVIIQAAQFGPGESYEAVEARVRSLLARYGQPSP